MAYQKVKLFADEENYLVTWMIFLTSQIKFGSMFAAPGIPEKLHKNRN